MSNHRALTIDNDLEGLIPLGSLFIRRAHTPMLFYFRAEGALLGHVSWQIDDHYVSLTPDHGEKLMRAARKRGGRYTNGYAITNFTPPFQETPTPIKPTARYRAAKPDYRFDRDKKLGRYQVFAIDTKDYLNLAAMKVYTWQFIKTGWNLTYALHDLWWFDGSGKPTRQFGRKNCIEMSISVFIAGLYKRDIPSSFLEKHPAFRDVTGTIQRRVANGYSANSAIEAIMKRPDMRKKYLWVRDVKNLVRDYVDSRSPVKNLP